MADLRPGFERELDPAGSPAATALARRLQAAPGTPLALYRGTLDAYRKFYSLGNDLRKLPTAISKARSAFHAFAGGTWPILKNLGYWTERLANRDYLRLLEEVSAGGRPGAAAGGMLGEPPDLLQDLLTGRSARGVVSTGLTALDRGRAALRWARAAVGASAPG